MNLLSDAIRIDPWLTWDDYSIQSVLSERSDDTVLARQRSCRNRPDNGVRKYSAIGEVQRAPAEREQPPPQTPPKVNILLFFIRECLDLCASRS